MKIIKYMTTVAIFAVMPNIVIAEEAPSSAVGAALPENVRVLLIQEMMALRNATQNLMDGLVQGRDEVVAENAQAMHDSFIMAKKMTAADKEALVKAVPAAFLEKDKAFHKLSAQLAKAAESGDRPKQNELFAELINACAQCHAAHASDRFPGFSSGQ